MVFAISCAVLASLRADTGVAASRPRVLARTGGQGTALPKAHPQVIEPVAGVAPAVSLPAVPVPAPPVGDPAARAPSLAQVKHELAIVDSCGAAVSDFALPLGQSIETNFASGAGSGQGNGQPSLENCLPVTGPMSPSQQSTIMPDGTATIPQDAPLAVQRAIAAGNQIIHTFYSQERRPGMLTHIEDSYDCSGSSAFVLYNAGLSDPTVDVGDGIAGNGVTMEAYGLPGWGQWVTVFASNAHEFLKVDNIVLDTAWYGPVQPNLPPSGPRWQPASIIPAQLGDGNGWIERHPPGL